MSVREDLTALFASFGLGENEEITLAHLMALPQDTPILLKLFAQCPNITQAFQNRPATDERTFLQWLQQNLNGRERAINLLKKTHALLKSIEQLSCL